MAERSFPYRTITAVDVGSTTTKVVLIDQTDGRYRVTGRAEARTTVEAPQEDVMIGLRASLRRLQEQVSRRFLDGDRLIIPRSADGSGTDLFVATSSAGGGLQMMCVGLMRAITAESAERAALGAGAIVMGVVAADDGRSPVERVRLLRSQRPDIILLAGGTDEGNISHVAALAEYAASANPRSRLGGDRRLPVIYAGNRSARDVVTHIMEDVLEVHAVDNIRPTLEEEILEPVRGKIHELFLDHVMEQAPGYGTLLEWTDRHIQPTPAAVGRMMRTMAARYSVNVVGVDIGGATTDPFSVMGGVFNRSVSANVGMSYSVANVLTQVGTAGISRWLPVPVPERDLRNWLYNKTIRPWGLPITLRDLMLEHAVGREGLRLALDEHRKLAVGLKGIKQVRTYDHALDQTPTGQTLVNMNEVDVIVGSGGLLSHAPRRSQAAMMMLDALGPEGVVRLYVDSAFILPHLGAVAEVLPDVAGDVLINDCLVPLGTVVAPSGEGRRGAVMAELRITRESGEQTSELIRMGSLRVHPVRTDERVHLDIVPRSSFDLGDGPGVRVRADVRGGEVGLIIDGRGRPLRFPRRENQRREAVRSWVEAMDAYPRQYLQRGCASEEEAP
ncbi:MAG: glutamate mutase L [Bacillota bacterium]